MKGRYPRSVSEFAANQRHVIVYCGECSRKREVVNDVLEAMLGPDFDLYDGYAALTSELRCDQCGKKHRLILFNDRTPRDPFVDVGFEDAVTRELERRAYMRARGEESTAVRGWVRRRR